MKQRVLTSVLLAPLVLIACVVRTPYPLFLICLVTVTLAFWELRSLAGNSKSLPIVTLFGLVVPFYGTQIQPNRSPIQVLLYACVFWLIGTVFAYRIRLKKVGPSELDLAGLWISMPFTCILMLHRLKWPDPDLLGRTPFAPDTISSTLHYAFILLILLPLWAGDIGALLVGKRFGRHLLWSKLSPNKSWEGAVANLLLCVLVAGLLTFVLGDTDWPHLQIHLLCGVVIGIVGQFGDLFESSLKRSAAVKDSGSILPGHGGLLDRIDSLLFAAPIVSLILALAFRG